MIRTLYRTRDGQVRRDLEPDDFKAVLQDREGMLWVDFVAEPTESCEEILSGVFDFHPLAIDDALQETHIPKVNDWGQYLYLVLHGVALDQNYEEALHTLELDIFVGKNYIVTYQSRAVNGVGRVWESCLRDNNQLQKGVGHLIYQIADELITDYMPVIESIDESIDEIEFTVFNNPTPSLLEKIFTHKRALLHLRRIIAPQREVLNKLSRGDFTLFSSESRVFFRDAYDHLVRLYDIIENLRDLVGSVLDTYLSVVNNRMNEIMKTLTILTVLLMPLSFVTGFFGMNFFEVIVPLPAWTSQPVFILMLLFILIIPIGIYLWMRRRAWM